MRYVAALHFRLAWPSAYGFVWCLMDVGSLAAQSVPPGTIQYAHQPSRLLSTGCAMTDVCKRDGEIEMRRAETRVGTQGSETEW